MFIDMTKIEWPAHALITLFLCSGGIFRRRGFGGILLKELSDIVESGILRVLLVSAQSYVMLFVVVNWHSRPFAFLASFAHSKAL